jgi:hypothetical protein
MLVSIVWHRRRAMSVLLGVSGILMWTVAWLVFISGNMSHTGVMESPFMLYIGLNMMVHSASLSREASRR